VLWADSITQASTWEELLPELPTANRGIGGDTTTDLLARLHDRFEVWGATWTAFYCDLRKPAAARYTVGRSEEVGHGGRRR
jgi:hypothetical protein